MRLSENDLLRNQRRNWKLGDKTPGEQISVVEKKEGREHGRKRCWARFGAGVGTAN